MTKTKLHNELLQFEKGKSLFEKAIRQMPIQVLSAFLNQGNIRPIAFKNSGEQVLNKTADAVKAYFNESYHEEILAFDHPITTPVPKKAAVLFSGGPAAGGHNVIAGLKKALGGNSTLCGVKSGPKGLLQGDLFEITDEHINSIINTGGFDFLGSDRTKIKDDVQFQKVKLVCKENQLDAIVIIGGDDSNTNAAMIAKYLYKDVHDDGRGVQVIGVPKTIDGDLQVGRHLPISFGFDTATKIYSELVGNILQDTPSSQKYWHFIKLMGRSASHVALEVALQSKSTVTLISEEIAEKQLSLQEIVLMICKSVIQRRLIGKNYGVVIVPEGLIEFIPEMKVLISELNDAMAEYAEDIKDLPSSRRKDFVYTKISKESAQLMASLPDKIEEMLLIDRDSHGNLQVSQIPTEELLIDMVRLKLSEIKRHPTNFFGKGSDFLLNVPESEFERLGNMKFSYNAHFFGYEGRCGAPSRFDASYCFNLGLTAASLILDGRTAYMASIYDLDKGGKPIGLPLTGLINVEKRHGKDELVIEKALVKLDSPAFDFLSSRRDDWSKDDYFASPGPRQLWGPIANQLPLTVALNQNYDSMTFNLGEDVVF